MNKKTDLNLIKTGLRLLSITQQGQIKGGGCCEEKRPAIGGKPKNNSQNTIVVITSTTKVIKP